MRKYNDVISEPNLYVMDKNFFKAAVIAGLIAGAVFMMLEMIMVPIFMNGSPWGPPRMIAAIIMGKSVLPMPGEAVTFNFGVMMVAIMLHFVMSIIYAIILGWFCKKLRLGTAIIVGAVFGLALYFINFFAFTGVFPWFAMARNWVTVTTHLIFGIVAGYSFYKIYQPVPVPA